MRRGFYYVIGALAMLVIVTGSAQVSVRSATCMACHTQEASFADWMKERLKAEKRGFSHSLIACADCHIQGAPEGTVMSGLRGLLHTVTYLVPQIDPRRPEVSGLFDTTRIPAENCNYCHLAAVERKAMYQRDLPAGLKLIGLAMDHRKHVIARDDTCAKCHERYKPKDEEHADKEVNYAEVNHLACDACHSWADHSYKADKLLPMTHTEFVSAREQAWKRLSVNPRWMVAMPTEQTCRRCHNGKIHYKTKIFLADCRNGKEFDECAKCHPSMTRQYFDNYRKERGKTVSASSDTTKSDLLSKR